MNKEYKEVFILKITPYSESDLILTYLTSEGEKRKGFVKKAKGSKKRFGGCLDNFNLVELYLSKSNQEDKLDSIYGAELKFANSNLRLDLEVFTYISVLAEIILEFHPQDEPHPEVFSFFNKVISHDSFDSIVFCVWIYQLLIYMGYNPNLTQCLSCLSGIDSNQSYQFIPHEGGFLCEKCHNSLSKSQIILEGLELNQFNHLLSQENDEGINSGLDSHFFSKFIQILDLLTSHLLRRPLRSLEFIK